MKTKPISDKVAAACADIATSLCYIRLVCLFVDLATCEAWASLSIFSWMDLDEILCLELHRAECT